MEEVAAVRRAALDAVGDVEPDPLHDRIRDRLDDGSMAPGVLTLVSASAVPRGDDEPDRSPDAVAERGAGVQLIYEGLRLTRTLSQAPPWEGGDGPSPTDSADELTDGGDVTLPGGSETAVPGPADGEVSEADLTDADMAILVADIMVARGFYLLARTEAAGEAVAVVQSFGRDQTTRRTTGDESLDGNLEADVFELAVVAGTTAFGGTASADLREYVADLARTGGPLPMADGVFTDATVETISGYLDPDVVTSADS